jgi:hypothetical protein
LARAPQVKEQVNNETVFLTSQHDLASPIAVPGSLPSIQKATTSRTHAIKDSKPLGFLSVGQNLCTPSVPLNGRNHLPKLLGIQNARPSSTPPTGSPRMLLADGLAPDDALLRVPPLKSRRSSILRPLEPRRRNTLEMQTTPAANNHLFAEKILASPSARRRHSFDVTRDNIPTGPVTLLPLPTPPRRLPATPILRRPQTPPVGRPAGPRDRTQDLPHLVDDPS